jgi:hypothetical protein
LNAFVSRSKTPPVAGAAPSSAAGSDAQRFLALPIFTFELLPMGAARLFRLALLA